ncbi:hypothetical protein Csa_000160 [Cucumis sativus]|nr:hypothetical protein Csa_000160 [Cucumis sativus]
MASKKQFSRIVAALLCLLFLLASTATAKRHLLQSPPGNLPPSYKDIPWNSKGPYGG